MTKLQRSFHSSSVARNIITLAALLCLLGATGQAQLKFNKPDFDTGKGPVSVATADFNRDGFPDLVTANSHDNSITVLINNANSTFGHRTDYPAGKNPVMVLTADFNHDGFADVAVLNQDDNSVSIFLGNGDGALRPSITLAVGQRPDIMISADFNKDGKPDLAVVNNAANTFTVYLGNGDGSFTHSADYPSGPGDPSFQNLDGIAAADFNGDGILDLAVTNGRSDNVSIFLGKPDGTFTAAGSFTLFGASGVVDGHIVTADFNQDGKADLLIQFVDCRQRGCSDGSMIFAGHGDGTFGSETSFPFNGFEPMIVADVNGDHVPDVIGTDGLVLVNPATVFTTGAVATPMAATGLGPLGLVAADFNGDGKLDVVTANSQDDTVSLLQGNGDGTFHQLFRMPYADPNFPPDSVITADFNRDGVPDMVLKNAAQRGVWLYLGNGDGTFQAPVHLAPDLEVFSMAAADLNNDGIPDLLLQGIINTQTINLGNHVLLGNGDGTFRPTIDSPGRGAFMGGMRLADVNGDGILDVITLASDISAGILQDAIAVSFGNGDGTFRTPVLTDIPFATSGLGVGDFDRDGKMDVVVGFTNISSNFESFVIYLGNGDGTFHAGQKYPAPGSPASFASADLNHDGLLDLVVLHGRSAAVFLGHGDGTFKQQVDMPIFGLPSQVQVADINGDGQPDIVAANERISVFTGNGDGTFQPRQDFATGGAAGDFNHDGAMDIVVASSNFPVGSISLLLTGSGPAPARDFVLNLGFVSQTLKAGQSAQINASIIGVGIFQDSVSFSCTGLPAGAACNFNPSAITPGANGQASAVLTIITTAPTSGSLRPPQQGRDALALSLPVIGVMLFGVRMRKKWTLLAILVLLAIAVPFLQGCAGVPSTINTSSGGAGGGSGNGGNGPGGNSGTPTGTYTITVVAAGAGSPAITHSQAIQVTVQ